MSSAFEPFAPWLGPLAPAVTFHAARQERPVDLARFGPVGTGVELSLDLRSPALEPALRARLATALGGLADERGVVLLVSKEECSHYRNRGIVVERLAALLVGVLPPPAGEAP